MQYTFTKMQGCGNDYIYFDTREKEIKNPAALSIFLSDRHFGVGGDGIILIGSSAVSDATMRIFNADGSEGKMCGNGIRCVGKYLYDKGIVSKEVITVETQSGVKTLQVYLKNSNGPVARVKVDMGKAEFAPEKIPVLLPGTRVVNTPIQVAGENYSITCVSMGNPHCVLFTQQVDALPLTEIGPLFTEHALFPQQANTEFVEVINQNTLYMRVWERGSGETFACGTGACAAAVAAVENGFCLPDEPILVKLRGGELSIEYTKETVWMTGEAVTVFEGSIEIKGE